MKIGIMGYGYVGRAMELMFRTNSSFGISIYDTDKKHGYFDKNNLKNCNLILVCVPTPQGFQGSCDLKNIEDAAHLCQEITPGALVCIKSAVSPGTTDGLNEIYDTDVFHVSPEYIGEGSNFIPPWLYPDPKNSLSHDFIIVGGPRASEVLDFFQNVMATTAKYVSCRAIEAELTKRMENAFLATKVSFCNQMYDIAEALGVDYKTLRELWLLDSRIGRSHTAVFPDKRGFGGKCLPKDLSALIDEAKEVNVVTQFLENVRDYNLFVTNSLNEDR